MGNPKWWADEQNLETAIKSVNDDYLFITDYVLKNREEWTMELKKHFYSGTYKASGKELLF